MSAFRPLLAHSWEDEPTRVGLIGCGNISDIYIRNARMFKDIDVVACADINPQQPNGFTKPTDFRSEQSMIARCPATSISWSI